MKSQNLKVVLDTLDVSQRLDRIEGKIDKYLPSPIPQDEDGVFGRFMSEEKAKEKLGRKTTWFYYQRKEGKLKPYRLGSKIFYEIAQLEKLIEDGAGQ